MRGRPCRQGSIRFVRSTVERLEPRQLLAAAPFAVGGDPSVDPADFRVTEFATGLDFPYGMQQLADGSMLVGTSHPKDGAGGGYFNSIGRLVRLVDADGDGAADGPPQILADNLPGTITDVRFAGNLVLVSGEGNSITVLRRGAAVADPFTNVGAIDIEFPAGWEHMSYSLAVRRTPGGAAGDFDVFFNVGSRENDQTTPDDVIVPISGLISGTAQGDSIYKVTIHDTGAGTPTLSNLTRVARGLRNAAGIEVDPASGDLYFEDNGIDTPTNLAEPVNADELNVLAAADIGGDVEDYGFAHDYIQYRTGQRIGSGAVQPIGAFQPIPSPNGSESEGVAGITLAPPAFPAALSGGVFLGFHGDFALAGLRNEDNPLVYFDRSTGKYFHFVSNDEPNIGHLDGLLSTSDSLFAADLAPTSDYSLAGSGKIYQIKAIAHQTPAQVVGRQVFYNHSAFDGNDAAATAADDNAIATDKHPLRSKQTVSPANITSYTRGLNGVMIDVTGLPSNVTLTADDFAFRSTRGNSATWLPGPTPISVDIRRGGGVSGGDRVTLVWRDYNPLDASPLPQAVANGWLEATILANTRTGLAASDVFAFGNLIGDTADGLPLAVTAADLVRTRNAVGSGAATPTTPTDFNRDGIVNASDLVLVRNNVGHTLAAPNVAFRAAWIGPMANQERPTRQRAIDAIMEDAD